VVSLLCARCGPDSSTAAHKPSRTAADNEIDALGGTTLVLLDANASLDNAVIFEARVSQVSEVRLADCHRAIAAFFARLHCEDGLHRCG